MSSMEIQNVISQMRALAQRSGIEVPGIEAPGAGQSVDKITFSDELTKALNQVNEMQKTAGQLQDKFIQGDPGISLAEVMAAGQKSNVAFQATLEVKNRFISAYQEIMRMQI